MKKLAKAQMGKMVKTAVKTVGNKYGPKATEVITKSVKSTSKPIFKKGAGAVAAGAGALVGAAGYITHKKKIGGAIKTKFKK